MNRNEYLKNLEFKNRALLLKIYNRELKKLKVLIAKATEKGNDTDYLNSLKNSVEEEIKLFDKQLAMYSAKTADASYKAGIKLGLLGVATNEVAAQFKFGVANRDAIKVLAKVTYEPLSKMAQRIGRATKNYMNRENFKDTQTVLKALGKFMDSEALRKTGIEGVANVVVGSESWQKAARDIRDKIIKDGGVKVPYFKKDGSLARMVDAQDYARMVARTTTANIAREGAKDSILDTFDGEFDLVEIFGISKDPNSPCIPYQHQILSIEGKIKGYTTFDEAMANGLFHVNCIHSFGISDKVMEIYRSDDWEINKDINLPKLEGKNVVLKQNIKERNNFRHPDLTDKDKKNALSVLYDNDLILQDKNKTNYYHYIKRAENTNYIVLLDKSKENFEIVHYHKINDKNLEKLIKKNRQ